MAKTIKQILENIDYIYDVEHKGYWLACSECGYVCDLEDCCMNKECSNFNQYGRN